MSPLYRKMLVSRQGKARVNGTVDSPQHYPTRRGYDTGRVRVFNFSKARIEEHDDVEE
jgi:hypothetical protein